MTPAQFRQHSEWVEDYKRRCEKNKSYKTKLVEGARTSTSESQIEGGPAIRRRRRS